jgi:c(7)-type cytochrome triheme protein
MRVFTSLADRLSLLFQATLAGNPVRVAFCVLAMLFSLALYAQEYPREWSALNKDGVHDPKSPAVKILQQPRDALSKLTADTAGNQVRWVQALDKKEIQPREKYFPATVVRKLDRDVILDVKGGMPAVRFPHRQHTEWLDCVNCHDGVFSTKPGEIKISMYKILQGEQCGICHGAVSFPLTECSRCHSVLRPGEFVPKIPPDANPQAHQPGSKGP